MSDRSLHAICHFDKISVRMTTGNDERARGSGFLETRESGSLVVLLHFQSDTEVVLVVLRN